MSVFGAEARGGEGEEQDQRSAGHQPAGAPHPLDDGGVGRLCAVVLLADSTEDEHLVVHGQPEQDTEHHDRQRRLDEPEWLKVQLIG